MYLRRKFFSFLLPFCVLLFYTQQLLAFFWDAVPPGSFWGLKRNSPNLSFKGTCTNLSLMHNRSWIKINAKATTEENNYQYCVQPLNFLKQSSFQVFHMLKHKGRALTWLSRDILLENVVSFILFFRVKISCHALLKQFL